ncbi:glycosyltransferase family 2 protein [Streptomyces sp. WZ-12]|uniref:glycosyltransferase family 2 protein n=1 Tax=Streptomyces sp. WZ-12 TaxID=3030210 RepID=UPI0023812E7B|nr:glycosyltransferase family 2 protein [Streptomyces sp. WZ-12]
MPGPDVTVIIPAYNAIPYVTRSVSSVLGQSLGADRIELIAIDDGSTDGTAQELDRLAARAPLMRVIHQPNSGGPAGPRNLGIGQAAGRYVFFLDADDHLGPEALQRMVVVADTNGSDVVLGRIVGEGGRSAPRSMFRWNQPRTDVFASRVYWTLNPMKLFRRELIDRLELRFDTSLSIGEDQPFVATAYLEAASVSVISDYDCLHWVAREDGNNITSQRHSTRMWMQLFKTMTELVAQRVPAGPDRDTLMHRHFAVELRSVILQLCQEPQRSRQDRLLREMAGMVALYWTEGLAARLPAVVRLRCHLIRHNLLEELLSLARWELDQGATSYGTTTLAATNPQLHVESGRAYALYPYFRHSTLNIPDDCYDITTELPVRHRVDSAGLNTTGLRLTGHAYIDRITTTQVSTELVLRERSSGHERRLPVRHTPTPGLGTDEDNEGYEYAMAGFDVTIDLAPLTAGLWDIFLAVGAQGITKQVRLGSNRTPSSTTATTTLITPQGTAATLYTTRPYGNLTLDIGESKYQVPPHLRVMNTTWSPDVPATLSVNGHCTLASWPQGSLALRARNLDGLDHTVAVQLTAPDGTFTALLPISTPGQWQFSLDLAVPGTGAHWTVPIPPQASLHPARWHRLGLPHYAKPLPGHDTLTLRVGRVQLFVAARNRLKRALGQAVRWSGKAH